MSYDPDTDGDFTRGFTEEQLKKFYAAKGPPIYDFEARAKAAEAKLAEVSTQLEALKARIAELERRHPVDMYEAFGTRKTK